jgi:predicted nuclease with TOPRIM domain
MTLTTPKKSALTTIKVSMQTRDRLKSLAQQDQCTLEEYVNKLIALAYREQRWDELRASVTKMTASQRAQYLADADAYQADPNWDGRTVAAEWQEEWDASNSA